MLITLIVPVFNGLAYTKTCIANLKESFEKTDQAAVRFAIVVTNDGSTDDTAAWLKATHPDVHLLQGDGNLWWSGGINLGVKYAIEKLGADYLVWWNNDIMAAPGYFNYLAEIVQHTETNVIVGSKIYSDPDFRFIWSMGGKFDTVNGRKYMTAMGEPDDEQYHHVFDADWLPGMGTIIHRSVFEKIGMLDQKNFPQYHGDSDFTFRAKLAGFRIVVYPQLKIYNDKTNSGMMHQNSFKMMIKSLSSLKSSYYFKKDLIFYRKYATSPGAYQTLLKKYGLYTGGFLKWKIMNLFGVRRK